MAKIAKQAETIRFLVTNSIKLQPAMKHAIADELNEIKVVARLKPPRRRRLLGAIHLARGLETALREVVSYHGLPTGNTPSMGSYLIALANGAVIPQSIRQDCHNRVRTLRNRLAHSAGEYPHQDHQLDSAAQAASACMAFMLK